MSDVKLFCTKCNKEFSADKVHILCDVCNEALEVETIKRGKICDGNALEQSIMERYREFYPFLPIDKDTSLGEGFTPLVESKKLAEELGVRKLYFKNETQNPTWSFKDRGTLTGVLHAIKLGYKKIGTVSTGNMAVSVAAYGSKANLETFIFVKKTMASEKLNPVAIYGPHLIKVDGDYGNLYFESLKIGKENDIYFINSDVPFRVEGYKTLAYEICEQLNFEIPDYVVVPTSAGGNIRGIEKGFEEFKNSGYIDKVPKMICAQASGCSPIDRAYHNDEENISRFENPNTIAHAIENPFPPSGNQVLRKLRQKDGVFISVSDEEIVKAQDILAREGIFAQPASAVPLAAVKKLKEENKLNGDEKIACVVTGSGLKYTAAFEKHDLKSKECKLEELGNFIAKNY
ncbi:threonine synthase [Wukongibacter baidiensis]|uniref:threonine synthase n=1 Tax=Wukongibacter baidiensis TaxID=1723361 RepID=UPI003D7F3DD8